MTTTACPRCQLPRDDAAWLCDGCGYVFDRDLAAVRVRLQTELRWRRLALVLTVTVSLVVVGGLVGLGFYGFIYVSVPLLLALVGGVGHAVHSLAVVRGHLQLLDRRQRPLPAATVHADSPDR